MKVIFTQNVSGVASRGDVKNVKNGFYRNYLLPYSKAVLATEHLMKDWEEKRKKLLIEKEQLKAKLEEILKRLEGGKLTVAKKVTKKGTLYGGIKPGDIAKELAHVYHIEIPENAIRIPAAIKSIGVFDLVIHLAEGIETHLPVEVVERA